MAKILPEDLAINLTPKQKAFLAAYCVTANIRRSAKAAKIAWRTHYDWLQIGEEYKRVFEKCKEIAGDMLESEAYRRALRGTLRPVFYKGDECGRIREYSDTLAIFLLKGVKPEKYKERVSNTVSGNPDSPLISEIRIVNVK